LMVHYQVREPRGWLARGELLPRFQGQVADDVLDQLGDEGWELIAIRGTSFYLKRPKT